MNEKNFFTQSVVFDPETRDQLAKMARADDRTNSALIRTLVRQEYARRYSQPNPCVTVEEAQAFTSTCGNVPVDSVSTETHEEREVSTNPE
jgi:hypothetical protein